MTTHYVKSKHYVGPSPKPETIAPQEPTFAMLSDRMIASFGYPESDEWRHRLLREKFGVEPATIEQFLSEEA